MKVKILWAARLCRPDFMKVIGDLTKRLTTWSVADDKRPHRLMGYKSTVKAINFSEELETLVRI